MDSYYEYTGPMENRNIGNVVKIDEENLDGKKM